MLMHIPPTDRPAVAWWKVVRRWCASHASAAQRRNVTHTCIVARSLLLLQAVCRGQRRHLEVPERLDTVESTVSALASFSPSFMSGAAVRHGRAGVLVLHVHPEDAPVEQRPEELRHHEQLWAVPQAPPREDEAEREALHVREDGQGHLRALAEVKGLGGRVDRGASEKTISTSRDPPTDTDGEDGRDQLLIP